MEGVQSALWLNKFVNFTKMVGNKIVDGAKIAAEKTKEGASYVAEKSKPATDKIKEGAAYLAEKTKPATDKIKEGAIYVGNHVKTAYNDVKTKVTGQPPQQQEQEQGQGQEQQGQKDEALNEIQNINENQDNRPLIDFDTNPNEPPINSEHLDDFTNINGNNPSNYYPNF